MKHLGDITKIHGDKIEPVDCITFGSPCQDLSIAGRRAGLAGERSGLFVEAVRIIKEMRSSTNGMYPTFAIWENVPGAFSSNGGEDFRAVLEELARVEQPDVTIPRPSRGGGRWSKAGAITGNGWSLAWRQLDAQYWGVSQRRKRIALVADFGGQRAGEILFERESVQGNPDEGIPPWKSVTGIAQNCTAGNDRVVGNGCYCIAGNVVDRSETAGANGVGATENVSYTLNTVDRHAVAYSFDSLASNSMKSSNPYSGCREVELARTLDTSIPDPSKNQGGIAIVEPVAYTIKIRSCREGGGKGALAAREKAGQNQQSVLTETEVRWIVRRLTPTECERLQGYPDGWTDIGEWADTKGKKHKPADTPRYKALGNSIALPQWFWIAQKMKLYLSANATLGSLFDGIGGFPLVWETTYGKGTARWASEIEEFPIAVTKRRFGEE